jgi:hypothetical protein
MKVVPQAVFLHLYPIMSPSDKARHEEMIENNLWVKGRLPATKHGYLFSFQGLVRKPGFKEAVNIVSGVKPASPDHLRTLSEALITPRQAAPYALLYVLWYLNHARLPQGLKVYCQPEVATVLTEGIETDFEKGMLHPRFRRILLRLLNRTKVEVIPVTEEDTHPFRSKWRAISHTVCKSMEDRFWKEWHEVPPMEWQSGKKGMTPRGRLVTEKGVAYSGK